MTNKQWRTDEPSLTDKNAYTYEGESFLGVFAYSLLTDDADVFQVPEDLVVVDGEADDELVRDLEAAEIREETVALHGALYRHRRNLKFAIL